MTVTVVPSHITIDQKGVARVDGTRIKVIHVAKESVARGGAIEQLREAFPHLSMGQIHAALAYYYDHQAQFDSEMQRELKQYQEGLAEAREKDSPLRKKLRELDHPR